VSEQELLFIANRFAIERRGSLFSITFVHFLNRVRALIHLEQPEAAHFHNNEATFFTFRRSSISPSPLSLSQLERIKKG
jgi:hypothetical protein